MLDHAQESDLTLTEESAVLHRALQVVYGQELALEALSYTDLIDLLAAGYVGYTYSHECSSSRVDSNKYAMPSVSTAAYAITTPCAYLHN